jgi:hypothetical protein
MLRSPASQDLFRRYAEQMLLLVDALDEAQTYTGVGLPDLLSRLDDLPTGVRILATTRDKPRHFGGGRCFPQAVQLAEVICRRDVASVEANSLCYLTPYSARCRRHVVPQDPVDVEAFRRELDELNNESELSGVASTCDRLEQQTGLKAWGEMSKALIAMSGRDASSARDAWLDAVVVAARLGRAEVGAVARIGEFVSWGGGIAVTTPDLRSALDSGDKIVTASYQ